MAKRSENMVLSALLAVAGYHYDSWRRPGSRMEGWGEFGLIKELVRKAEAAKFDMVFFGDIAGAGPLPGSDPTIASHYEPVTVMAALSAVTSHVGMVGTASTTFLPPFSVARQFAGLDKLSGGRVGFNAVSSSMGQRNFGLDTMPSGEDRYRQMAEFLDVAFALWDSWSDDAVVNDRARGMWADPTKIRAINHKGEFYSVEGPLNTPRSPQGRPIIVQAGSSDAGTNVGAKYADAIYTQQPEFGASVAFYDMFKDKARSFGRDPRTVKIIAGIVPILGETEAEARELEADLASYVNTDLGRINIGERLEMDLSELDLDEKIPAEWFVGPKVQSRSRYENTKKLVLDEGYTLRDLIHVNARSHGHQAITGTPAQVADRMIEWYDNHACDGFNINTPFMPGGFDLVTELLVPELVSRGYFREEYEGSTLRSHLGLERPGAWDAEQSEREHVAVG
ncbi:NtaA/DmoA family FMN-dependent monooxygenase [Mycobacterium sp. GA-2829]|uniref:NtaA/DmoA family FMN-dependent monooxygenase n=1 Tax=Mycobacterium sp. GA-2829 TaxID=1772283 RepID=UPI000740540A|nr:NtaA/DmoA family FMN-dependent monooxygenase [Mycobacterium sp. GA-2829]KUI36462.1 hypothetical protein AU194_08215 [Mycobacterium sp. GA-2829]